MVHFFEKQKKEKNSILEMNESALLSNIPSSEVSRRSLGEQLNKPSFVFHLFLHNSLGNIISTGILSSSHITYFSPRTYCTLFCAKQYFYNRGKIFPIIWKVCIWATCLIRKFSYISW